jgi:hypothetical protein
MINQLPVYWGRLSTGDLLIKIGCFIKKGKYSFSVKNSRSEPVSTRRSTVLILPLQLVFPGHYNCFRDFHKKTLSIEIPGKSLNPVFFLRACVLLNQGTLKGEVSLYL